MVEGQTTGVRVYREPSCPHMDYGGAFTVEYRMEGQQYSAEADVDFLRETGVLSFLQNENSKIINVNTFVNEEFEPSEFFNIYLENLQNLPCVNERILYKNPYQVLITDTGAPPCPRPTPTMTPTVTQTQTPTLVPPSDIHHKYERCDYISSGYYKYEICP